MLEYLHKFVINSALNIEVRKKFGIANTVTRTFLSPEPPLRLVTCREREVVENFRKVNSIQTEILEIQGGKTISENFVILRKVFLFKFHGLGCSKSTG